VYLTAVRAVLGVNIDLYRPRFVYQPSSRPRTDDPILYYTVVGSHNPPRFCSLTVTHQWRWDLGATWPQPTLPRCCTVHSLIDSDTVTHTRSHVQLHRQPAYARTHARTHAQRYKDVSQYFQLISSLALSKTPTLRNTDMSI